MLTPAPARPLALHGALGALAARPVCCLHLSFHIQFIHRVPSCQAQACPAVGGIFKCNTGGSRNGKNRVGSPTSR